MKGVIIIIAKEIMIKKFHSLTENDTLYDACKMMKQYDVGFIPIVNNNVCTNIITDRDIVLLLAKNLNLNTKLKLIPNKMVITVNSSDKVVKVYENMSNYQIKRIVVNNELNHIVGIISLSDIIRRSTFNKDTLDTIQEIKKPLVNNKNCPSNSIDIADYCL